MTSMLQKKIFSSLKISEEQILSEMAFLLAKQQLSEYSMEIDYFEKKYGKKFQEFESFFQTQSASYEMENDWMNLIFH
jgi:hypothetical protein